MGFKYTHRVYNDVQGTTPTEQQVLALLAHFADDKTGQCFPSIETLARQSHLHRVTVMRSLDSLKKKGLLKWISGGRTKKGRVLSNLYKLTLPKPAPKREEIEFAEFWEDVHNSEGWVAHRNGYPLHSATPQGCTALPPTVAQCNPIIYRTTKDHPGDHNPPEAGSEMPGSFELGRTDFCPRADGRLPMGGAAFARRHIYGKGQVTFGGKVLCPTTQFDLFFADRAAPLAPLSFRTDCANRHYGG